MAISEKLIEVDELRNILGYSDIRSVKKFCMLKKVPLINLGKKTYIISNFLDLIVSNKLRETYSNADEILKAIDNDNKSELAKLIDAPSEPSVKSSFNSKNKSSSAAAKNLIDKLNAA